MKGILIKRKLARFVKRMIILVISLGVIASAVFFYAERKILPMIKDIAVVRAKNTASLIISETVYTELENNKFDHGELITLEKDSSGHVSALKTNILKINSLKTYLTMAVSKELETLEDNTIEIPLGNIADGTFLSGRGPNVRIKLMQVGSVSADVKNEFDDAGINQTRHRLMLNVTATVRVIIPFSTVTEDVSTGICIAETVIVGNVPEAYTRVDYAPESAIGDVMDFGASGNHEIEQGIFD